MDEGNITLVNAKREADDSITETKDRTGLWAWKIPGENGNAPRYVELKAISFQGC